MNNSTSWILIDTETTGLSAPIVVVELAGQRMLGWQTDGAPFRRLLNQNADIPTEASRVHGYTREILERDGDPPAAVYRDFLLYVRDRPIVSYNLEYDLEEVLWPEWRRLGIERIGTAGFCALRLAQRLLDPVPAGNCKLQTLRQYYRLPERGAHTALGDVETVADLMANVLRPIAERRGLKSWSNICAYTSAEWYPSRIAFGKFKGRNFKDARKDESLRGWLSWLMNSSNPRSAKMGHWYLERLKDADALDAEVFTLDDLAADGIPSLGRAESSTGVVIYTNLEAARLRDLVAGARARLAEIETDYTTDRCAVEATRAKLFSLVKEHYRRRDRLRLVVNFRRKYLKTLLDNGEAEAAQVADDYQNARAQSHFDYEEATKATAGRRELSADEQAEIKALWKKLVRLYHPDRFARDAELLDTYEKLTMAINRAKEDGDIDLLREIARDPNGFILRQGWRTLIFDDTDEIEALRNLLDTLNTEILAKIEALNNLRESDDFELYRRSKERPGLIEEVAATQVEAIEGEIVRLQAEAEKLNAEIAELTGEDQPTIA